MDKVLIAEDSITIRAMLHELLAESGFDPLDAGDGREAIEVFESERPSAVLLDLNMPVMNGIEAMEKIKILDDTVPVIIVTATDDLDTAVDLMKRGAYDYLKKPVEPGKLIITVKRAVEKYGLGQKVRRLQDYKDATLEWALGKGPEIKGIVKQLKMAADTNFSVILQGETGTGKTYVAKILHDMSLRANKPYVRIDIGSIPETLIESELFGYEKGAYTGAYLMKKGYFELANGGSFFIDDLESLSYTVQGKLLNAVESKQVSRLGGRNFLTLDVRIIAATNKDIKKSVLEGKFREDLLYRLGEIIITLPPLRERLEDIPFLAAKFLEDASLELKKCVKGLSPEILNRLVQYNWPGNIRQLKNVMRRAALFSEDGEIKEEHLDFLKKGDRDDSEELPLMSLKEAVSRTENKLINETLTATKGNRSKASSILQIDIKTLRTKMSEYNIS